MSSARMLAREKAAGPRLFSVSDCRQGTCCQKALGMQPRYLRPARPSERHDRPCRGARTAAEAGAEGEEDRHDDDEEEEEAVEGEEGEKKSVLLGLGMSSEAMLRMTAPPLQGCRRRPVVELVSFIPLEVCEDEDEGDSRAAKRASSVGDATRTCAKCSARGGRSCSHGWSDHVATLLALVLALVPGPRPRHELELELDLGLL